MNSSCELLFSSTFIYRKKMHTKIWVFLNWSYSVCLFILWFGSAVYLCHLEHLKKDLEEHIKQFGGKVRLIRNTAREGLIRTRTIGAVAAVGDVVRFSPICKCKIDWMKVIFLDAHCEPNKNWLPPLLAPIRHNKRVMTVPVIDGIDMNTFVLFSFLNSS